MPKNEKTKSPEEKLKKLQHRIKKISNRLDHIIQLDEMNKIIAFSDNLSGQIPESYAGNAFHCFRVTFIQQQAILLSTLWDSASSDRMSFPSLIKDIDDDIIRIAQKQAVQNLENCEHNYLFIPAESKEEEDKYIQNEREFFKEQAKKGVIESREKAQKLINITKENPKFQSFHAARNSLWSHYLDVQNLNQPTHPVFMKAEYPSELLKASLECCNHLNYCLSKTTNCWKSSVRNKRLYAQNLWHNCTFNIPT